MTLGINLLTLIIGLAIGIKFADIDLAPVFRLAHRSAWTHGALIVFPVLWLAGQHPLGYWLAVGFLPAHALHLLADMFPRNWKGGAMIKFHPIKKQLSPVLSFAWLALGVLVSASHWLRITGGAWGWTNSPLLAILQ